MTTSNPSALGTQPPIGPSAAKYPAVETADGAAPSSSSSSVVGSNPTPTVFLSTTTPNSAYLTPATYQALLSKTLSLQTNPAAILTYESRRQQACGLIAAVGARVGLPQRTINTAFVIWQKCGINRGAPSGTSGQHVALAALFLACKLNDTSKKARDLIVASYALRYPDLVKVNLSSLSSAAGPISRAQQMQQLAFASVQESDVDTHLLDSERNKVLSLERTLLEDFGYDFKIREGVEAVSRGVIKLGRAWGASKQFIQDAWQIASDLHRTSAPLLYPPLVLSLAALLTASLLCPTHAAPPRLASARRIKRIFGLGDVENLVTDTFHTLEEEVALSGHERDHLTGNGQRPTLKEAAQQWARDGSWEEELRSWREEIEEVAHSVLDLYISSCSTISAAQPARGGTGLSPTSPSTTPISPASPSEYGSTGLASAATKNRSAGSSSQSIRLPPHTFNPPPFGVINWLHAHDGSQLDASQVQPNGPTDMARVLTQCKIELRGAEEARKKGDQELRVQIRDIDSSRGGKTMRRLARRSEIEEEKAKVQIVKVEVQGSAGEVDETAGPMTLVQTVSHLAGGLATPSTTMSLTLTPLQGQTGVPELGGTVAGVDATTITTPAQNGSRAGGGSARSYKTLRFLF